MHLLAEFHIKKGTPLQSVQQQTQYLEQAGFVDIQVIEKTIDCGAYTEGMANFELF